ncbi:hypothetical protein BD560DRAFT_388470 [Blakeslea trispora]|nr:hypothetical protein BD560DRAFT_388470 [Blakeslea trispora]
MAIHQDSPCSSTHFHLPDEAPSQTLLKQPSFESLQEIKLLRTTKSCCQLSEPFDRRQSILIQPRLYPLKTTSKKPIDSDSISLCASTSSNMKGGGPMRFKRSIFHTFTNFIQKANKKIRSTPIRNKKKKENTIYSNTWAKETRFDALRLSSDSSISTLQMIQPSTSHSSLLLENWWLSSPPISSF